MVGPSTLAYLYLHYSYHHLFQSSATSSVTNVGIYLWLHLFEHRRSAFEKFGLHHYTIVCYSRRHQPYGRVTVYLSITVHQVLQPMCSCQYLVCYRILYRRNKSFSKSDFSLFSRVPSTYLMPSMAKAPLHEYIAVRSPL